VLMVDEQISQEDPAPLPLIHGFIAIDSIREMIIEMFHRCIEEKVEQEEVK
jgi:hypothetical protein